MQTDRKDLILKSAVDGERQSLLRRVEELDASLFDTQALSQKLESELEEAKERIDQLSQGGLTLDDNRPRDPTGDYQNVSQKMRALLPRLVHALGRRIYLSACLYMRAQGKAKAASYRTRIPKAELERQQREFEEKKLDKLRSNGLRMARLIKKWSKVSPPII